MSVFRRVGVTEAKAKLSELIRQVADHGERIVIERRGKPVAALVPIKDLERVTGELHHDWLDDIVGLCADCEDLCDELDRIVAERHAEMPRDVKFWWDDEQ